MFFALEIALRLRPRAIPCAETIFHGMSLLSSTYCINMNRGWFICPFTEDCPLTINDNVSRIFLSQLQQCKLQLLGFTQIFPTSSVINCCCKVTILSWPSECKIRIKSCLMATMGTKHLPKLVCIKITKLNSLKKYKFGEEQVCEHFPAYLHYC